MEFLRFIKLALPVVISVGALYWIYRVIKWAFSFKITIKFNHPDTDKEDHSVNFGNGGPLVDRSNGQEADRTYPNISPPPIPPSNRKMREGQVPVPPPKNGVNYEYLQYLLQGAENFSAHESPESELHYLGGLIRFAEIYEKRLTEHLGFSIKRIPDKPHRPTSDQPK